MDTLESALHAYVVREFLGGRGAGRIKEDTPLITGGILDSLATLKLAGFLEEEYGIKVEAHEAGIDYLNTIGDIARFVRSKQSPGGKGV